MPNQSIVYTIGTLMWYYLSPLPLSFSLSLSPFSFHQVVELDLSQVVPSVSGPKRPHDRVSVSDMSKDFAECLQNKVTLLSLSLSLSFNINTFLHYVIVGWFQRVWYPRGQAKHKDRVHI